jgi:alpha/beta hydrolase family protein
MRTATRVTLALGTLLLLAFATVAGAAIPNPTVTGPIPVTAKAGDPSHNYIFISTSLDIASRGYVEEEYFLQGTANQYTTPTWTIDDPAAATATIKSSNNPYEIRMIVRRPIDSKKFNGVVIVDWMNVTNLFEYDTEWIRAFDYIMRTGAVYVGVGVQQVGLYGTYGLKWWNPTRYADLVLLKDDSLKYDALSQAAQALRQPVGIDPLSGLRPKVLIATGDSQSASNLATYANAIHVLDPIFDVFVPTGNLGRDIRTDLTTKYWKVNSDYDVISRDAKVRRPDTDRFVTWEIAGASHTDYHNWVYAAPVRLRDTGLIMPPPDTTLCVLAARSRVHYYLVFQSALDHAIRWVTQGIQPPSAPFIEIADMTPSPVIAARDSFGIVKGGLRLADVEVPTALNGGWNYGKLPANNSTCQQQLVYIPFQESTEQTVTLPVFNQTFTLPALDALYKNHGSYVSQVTQVTNQNVKAGYLLKEDGQVIQQEAVHSTIGK